MPHSPAIGRATNGPDSALQVTSAPDFQGAAEPSWPLASFSFQSERLCSKELGPNPRSSPQSCGSSCCRAVMLRTWLNGGSTCG